MARKRRSTVGSKYVAEAAIRDHLAGVILDQEKAEEVGRWLVRQAWDVEHFPTAGRVTITFDLQALERPDDEDDGPREGDLTRLPRDIND